MSLIIPVQPGILFPVDDNEDMCALVNKIHGQLSNRPQHTIPYFKHNNLKHKHMHIYWDILYRYKEVQS